MTKANKIVDQASLIKALSQDHTNQKVSTILNMIHFIAEGIFVLSEQGVIEVINPIAAKFFGASEHTLIGQRWFDFLHDRYQEEYEYIFSSWSFSDETMLNHGPKEILLKRPDGSGLEVDLSLSVLPGLSADSGKLIVGVVHNLSEHKREYSELRRQASTDHLTGLANRYDLEKKLAQSWTDCVTHKQPLSLVIIDVDYFKYFNDQFGHVNGDKCLQKIAKVIDSCLPNRECLAARYGGEEFALILPRCPIRHAEQVSIRIQHKINALNFADLGLPTKFKVSVSQGIACEQSGQYRTSEALICAADTALYRAKSEGRNRINISL